MGRVALLSTFAAQAATADAGLDKKLIQGQETGIAIGSTTGSAAVFEKLFTDFYRTEGFREMEGTMFPKVMSHTAAANAASTLGITGPVLAPCSACASATQAIGAGFESICSGQQRVMLCGGAEDLHPATVGVFDVLGAASRGYNDRPSATPRPFDRDRDGLVISEGAAVVVLEEYEHARSRGAQAYGEVLGYATGCDAHHMTQPSAEGMLRCMRRAMDNAGRDIKEVDYINAHATGTRVGDAAEAEAIRELAGDAVPVSGTKGYTGHTLGACGAMEVIFCLMMMREGFLAATLNLENVDAECRGLAHVQERISCRPKLILTSNFAFGGINASLVMGKVNS
jgi:3-oxoacyl-[acyl-carrier-protein] synthase II